LDGQSVKDHPFVNSPHEDQHVAVEAPTLEQASETVTVAPKIKLKKCFEDKKLFANLEKLPKYYLDWRTANPGCDVKDGSLNSINNSASMFPEKLKEHLTRRIKCDGLKSTSSNILT